jgi:hypothetical protein
MSYTVKVFGSLEGENPFPLGSVWQADIAETVCAAALLTGADAEAAVLNWFHREDRWPVQDVYLVRIDGGPGHRLYLDFFVMPPELECPSTAGGALAK